MLATQAGTVVLDDTALGDLDGASIPRPPTAHRLITGARMIATPGRLRRFVIEAATREGCTVTEVGRAGLSRVHGDGCGYENPSDDRYQSALVRCDGCGATYDQDHAATALMLHRARR